MVTVDYGIGEVIDERTLHEYREVKIDVDKEERLSIELKCTTNVDIIGNKYILEGFILSFHPDELKDLIEKLSKEPEEG